METTIDYVLLGLMGTCTLLGIVSLFSFVQRNGYKNGGFLLLFGVYFLVFTGLWWITPLKEQCSVYPIRHVVYRQSENTTTYYSYWEPEREGVKGEFVVLSNGIIPDVRNRFKIKHCIYKNVFGKIMSDVESTQLVKIDK